MYIDLRDDALLISDQSGSDEQKWKCKRGAAWLPKNYNKLTVDDETNIDHKLCHGKKLKFFCNSVRWTTWHKTSCNKIVYWSILVNGK